MKGIQHQASTNAQSYTSPVTYPLEVVFLRRYPAIGQALLLVSDLVLDQGLVFRLACNVLIHNMFGPDRVPRVSRCPISRSFWWHNNLDRGARFLFSSWCHVSPCPIGIILGPQVQQSES